MGQSGSSDPEYRNESVAFRPQLKIIVHNNEHYNIYAVNSTLDKNMMNSYRRNSLFCMLSKLIKERLLDSIHTLIKIKNVITNVMCLDLAGSIQLAKYSRCNNETPWQACRIGIHA